MKLTNLILPVLLPALTAANAAAAVDLSVAAAVNPLAGMPRILPGPVTGPLKGVGINLPGTGPSRVNLPTIRMGSFVSNAVTAPRIETISAPVPYVPERPAPLPMIRADAGHENVVNPLAKVLPDSTIRFAAESSAKPESQRGSQADQEKLDQFFDGNGGTADAPTVELPRRAPVKPARRISLPEWDLESELGLSSAH